MKQDLAFGIFRILKCQDAIR
jgi:hypothetical protein